MTRLLCLAWLLMLPASAPAQRLSWKVEDFVPLTGLPWEKKGATMDEVLKAVFREPNPNIRYPVLAAYLEVIPAEQFEEAFKTCIKYEGAQNPEALVEMLLRIWGRRDPEGAWKKTRALFEVVIYHGDPLHLDRWKRRPIQPANLLSLRSSTIWLTGGALNGLPVGVENSMLPQPEKVRLLKEFSNLYIERFKRVPRPAHEWPISEGNHGDGSEVEGLMEVFHAAIGDFPELTRPNTGRCERLAVEVAYLRWLALKPTEARKLLQAAEENPWRSLAPDAPPKPVLPTTEFLRQWALSDPLAMFQWAEEQDIRKSSWGIKARAMLMGHLDAETLKRWMAEAKGKPGEDDRLADLLEEWAVWNPKEALQAAANTRNASALVSTSSACAGTLHGTWNASHFGVGELRIFDIDAALAALPEPERDFLLGEWGWTPMEQWIDIDVGEAAKYGFAYITKPAYAKFIPKENLIRLFSGDDQFASDSDMIDRTFCALRFWAAWKPQEMHPWIVTIEDTQMRKALTWLMENPWGTGEDEPEGAKGK